MSIPKTQKAIVITAIGDGYDVIKYADLETPKIGDNEILIKNKYAGINYIESYFRKGIYPVAKLPYTLGRDASGVVAAVGSAVSRFTVGDKVAYLNAGTFAQYTKVSGDHVTISKLPKDASEEDLKLYGSILVQALTAIGLSEEAHKIEKGQFVLVWAAVGGVGSVLTQLAAAKGAHVIAISSTPEKLELAKKLGAEYVINHKTEDIAAKVLEYTKGKGVAVTYDSVGKATFDISYNSLARKGSFVSYGNTSGPLPPLEITKLTPKNAKFLRPGLYNYLVEKEEWDYYFDTLKKLIDNGLILEISKVYPLSDYAEAARSLESGKTTGKLTLAIPQ